MRSLLLLLAVALPLASAEAPRRSYIAPDDHTDYMWTAAENAYRQAFIDRIDYYLDQADRTAAHRAEHQGRWNCDGSFWMWTYEKNRTAAQFQRTGYGAVVVSRGGNPRRQWADRRL